MAKRESESIERSELRAQSSAAPRAGPHAINRGSFSAPDSRPLQRCLLRPPQGAPTDTPLSRAIATVRSNGKPHESNSRKATSAGSAVACRRSSARSSARSICASQPASHRHHERTGRARSRDDARGGAARRGEARHGACCALRRILLRHGKQAQRRACAASVPLRAGRTCRPRCSVAKKSSSSARKAICAAGRLRRSSGYASDMAEQSAGSSACKNGASKPSSEPKRTARRTSRRSTYLRAAACAPCAYAPSTRRLRAEYAPSTRRVRVVD